MMTELTFLGELYLIYTASWTLGYGNYIDVTYRHIFNIMISRYNDVLLTITIVLWLMQKKVQFPNTFKAFFVCFCDQLFIDYEHLEESEVCMFSPLQFNITVWSLLSTGLYFYPVTQALRKFACLLSEHLRPLTGDLLACGGYRVIFLSDVWDRFF